MSHNHRVRTYVMYVCTLRHVVITLMSDLHLKLPLYRYYVRLSERSGILHHSRVVNIFIYKALCNTNLRRIINLVYVTINYILTFVLTVDKSDKFHTDSR